MAKVFISYARLDADKARKLYKQIEKFPGVKPWLDEYSLLPGLKWKPAVRKAIRESEFFLALLSNQSHSRRGYRNVEFEEALEVLKEFPQDHAFLIPLRLDDCEMPRDEFSELNWIDMFPKWNEGINKLSPVISPERTQNNQDQSPRASRYHYRVALCDLDIGLTNLKEFAQCLNSVQSFFHFTCPELPSVENAVEVIDGFKQLATYEIPSSFYTERIGLGVDYVACLTRYSLAFVEDGHLLYNYFSGSTDEDERFIFLSTDFLYEYCRKANRTFDEGLVHILVGQLTVFFSDLGFHSQIRSCVMDFCENRTDQIFGLTDAKFCSKCLRKLENTEYKDAVEALLAWKS